MSMIICLYLSCKDVACMSVLFVKIVFEMTSKRESSSMVEVLEAINIVGVLEASDTFNSRLIVGFEEL